MNKEKENRTSDILSEPSVWEYQQHRLSPGEFVTAMVHFYRGEVSRCNTWRSRLDITTNWSVVTVGAVLTFAFSADDRPHVVILISMLLIWIFLVSEARRYRYYELWALRVRLMETDFFAAMLQSDRSSHEEWASRLIDSLVAPEFPISYWEALGRRLRRNYLWLFLILGLSWALKLALYPTVTQTWESFLQHAAVGFVPGWVILAALSVFYFGVFLIAFLTAGLQYSPGEILSRREILEGPTELLQHIAKAASDFPFLGRRNQLAIVITERPDEVGKRLLSIIKRGITALQGSGMYSKQSRSVLFCAVSPSEIEKLKIAVHSADEKAFIVVNPAEQVIGAGFGELMPRWRRRSRNPKSQGNSSG